ncbi:NADP-dependent oxidoreductase domain-containing protein [Rhodocollybia butyracea]|uniref:NADP-dependent oxidoreductase domain-containing protein n=1 Tax=Rhodocollybia butyracea TaxID=206335 RepID=A0A9P5TYG5_9AGAR|nr:NADP-dependent oxidoreductase domain-containing protein [Rhodocollybia butyracea]
MPAPSIKLNNGVEIPAIGLGTWQSKPEEVVSAVSYALKEAGYRHIDCAWGYSNEKEVGQGIKQSGVPRSEIFITSKLWGTYHSRVEEALDETLANLGTDYLDLYLIHWPVPMNPKGNHPTFPTLPNGLRDVDHSWKLSDTWKQMEAMVKKGKVKTIGISNFSIKKMDEILPTAEIILPSIKCLELHPYNPQHELLSYLHSKGIVPEAYSPLGSTNSPLLKDDVVVRIAQKHSVQPSDVLLGWLVAHDIVALPKSVTPSRIASNMTGTISAVGKLDKEDIVELDGLAASGKQKRFIMPPWPVDLGFDNWTAPMPTAKE